MQSQANSFLALLVLSLVICHCPSRAFSLESISQHPAPFLYQFGAGKYGKYGVTKSRSPSSDVLATVHRFCSFCCYPRLSTSGLKATANTIAGNMPRQSRTPKAININRALFGIYTLIGTIGVPSLLPNALPATIICRILLLSTVWLGFVLAISGLEAWLKFRAPLCPKPFALDIGRTIFPALNSVELGLCVSLLGQMYRSRSSLTHCFGTQVVVLLPLATIGIPAVILASQILVLTPKLVRRGKQVVYRHVQEHGGAKVDSNSSVLQELQRDLHGIPFQPTNHWHIVYVGLELVKLIALTTWIRILALHIMIH